MRPRLEISAFSSAQENIHALEEWRKINDRHTSNLKAFCHRRNVLKKKAKDHTNQLLWIADRDALAKEQEVCEMELRESLKKIDILDDDNSSVRAKWSLQEKITQQLQAVQNELQVLKKANPFSDYVEPLKSKILELKVFIKDELKRTEADIVTQGEEPSSKIDVNDILIQTRSRIEQLQEKFLESKKIHDAFSEALQHEQERLLTYLAENRSTSSPVSSAKVLNTITLLLKLAERGRQADASLPLQKQLRDRVSITFPELSKSEINVAIEESLQQRKHQQLIRAFVMDHRRATEKLFNTYETALEIDKGRQEFEACMKAEKDISLKRLEYQHLHLAQQREEYEERCKESELRERELCALKEKQDYALKVKRMEEFQKRLQQLVEYEKIRCEIKERESQLQMLLLKEEEEKKAERMEQNSKRVVFRQRKYAEKIEHRQSIEKELIDLKQQKEKTIQSFFDSVERRIGVQSDPKRLRKATESSAQSHSYIPFAASVKNKIMGYTDDEIMRDPRMKLYYALLEAGLHKTAYGREVVSHNFKIQPAQQANEANPLYKGIP
ncbi:unnamed protein product [Phytomonas sp. Hart1]|nr:unnamed protein product [Phytomonas sp. Hart1]|eukprot:CCW71350.1 unnamed protein product [Phytomonas sp. isolate Hart1]